VGARAGWRPGRRRRRRHGRRRRDGNGRRRGRGWRRRNGGDGWRRRRVGVVDHRRDHRPRHHLVGGGIRAASSARDVSSTIARTREALGNAAREIEMAGGEALALPLDIADAPAVDRAADEVVARWGRIDTWVNDAMVSVFSPVREMTAEEYRRVTEVNYLGTVYGTLAALRHMRRVGEGTIIQIGSALVYRSIPLQSAYCASKAAIRGF